MRYERVEFLLGKTIDSKNKGHLECVGERSEDSSAHGGVAYPEGCSRVPQDKGAVVPPPEMPDAFGIGKDIHKQQRDETDKDGRTCIRDQERHTHKSCEQQRQH